MSDNLLETVRARPRVAYIRSAFDDRGFQLTTADIGSNNIEYICDMATYYVENERCQESSEKAMTLH